MPMASGPEADPRVTPHSLAFWITFMAAIVGAKLQAFEAVPRMRRHPDTMEQDDDESGD